MPTPTPTLPTSPDSPTNSQLLEEALCPDCGYSLRALTSERCPECGAEIASFRTAESGIPWVHRRRLGRIRAYWQTIFFVMFHGRRFRLELVRPVAHRDAQRFWLVVILQAWLAVLAVAALWSWVDPPSFVSFREFLGRPLLATLVGCILLWLFAVTGVCTYLFHTRSLSPPAQERAIALTYYSVAPLGFLWLVPAEVLAIYSLIESDRQRMWTLAAILAAAGGVMVSAITWKWLLDLFRLAERVHRSRLRAALFLLAAFGLMVMVSVLILVLLPLSVFYLQILIESFRV